MDPHSALKGQNESDYSSYGKSVSSTDSSLHSNGGDRDMQNDALPPTPLTGRPAGYDPNRIPASIFASKPSTPMDWSVTSNESLFSIHVGNSSFSRDQYSIIMAKSEELPKLDDQYLPSFGPSTETQAANIYKQNDDGEVNISKQSDDKEVDEEVNVNKQGDDKENNSSVNKISVESTKAVSSEPAIDPSKDNHRMAAADDASSRVNSPVATRMSPSPSEGTRTSVGSGGSVSSFAFQVLDGAHGSSSTTGSVKTPSLPQAEREPESAKRSEPEVPKEFPTTTKTSWFGCFFCCTPCH